MVKMLLTLCLVLSPWARPVLGQEGSDVADVPSEDLRAGKDRDKRFFLIGPAKKKAKGPFGLVLVLPGGAGNDKFHPFVKRIFKYALGKDYLVAQLVAKKWTSDQVIVWPTARNKVKKMNFTTEEFASAVIKDVGKKHKLDARRIFTLSWSSGGPAAYSISLARGKVRGSLIAMSVFNPKHLPPLKKAKGHAYYLLHSPDDRICPYRMAEEASKSLPKQGAKATLVSYKGGHGWRMAVYPALKKGIGWLEKNARKRK